MGRAVQMPAPTPARRAWPAPSRRQRHLPTGPADQALRMLLQHSEWWERLDADDHELLHKLPEPHGALCAWLERELHEHGAQPWPTLQALLAEQAFGEVALRLMGSMAVDDVVGFDDLRTVVNLLWRQHLALRSEALAALGAADPQARQELADVLGRLRALSAQAAPKP
jgi:DNA primase